MWMFNFQYWCTYHTQDILQPLHNDGRDCTDLPSETPCCHKYVPEKNSFSTLWLLFKYLKAFRSFSKNVVSNKKKFFAVTTSHTEPLPFLSSALFSNQSCKGFSSKAHWVSTGWTEHPVPGFDGFHLYDSCSPHFSSICTARSYWPLGFELISKWSNQHSRHVHNKASYYHYCCLLLLLLQLVWWYHHHGYPYYNYQHKLRSC